VDIIPQPRRARKVPGGKIVILGIRLASGAVDAVKSVDLGLGRLWRILVCQPLEPTHDVISHSDPGEAVDRARQAGGADCSPLSP
jgi:hypothetical protein